MSNDASFLDEQVDVIDHEGEQEESFNFEQHRDSAVEAYRRVRSRYENFANAVKEILVQVLRTKLRHKGVDSIRRCSGNTQIPKAFGRHH